MNRDDVEHKIEQLHLALARLVVDIDTARGAVNELARAVLGERKD